MNIDHKKIILALGGPLAVSARLGIKAPSVYGWMSIENGIPDSRLIELGADIEALGICTRKELRPNDWQKIWPELASQPIPQAQITVAGVDVQANGELCVAIHTFPAVGEVA